MENGLSSDQLPRLGQADVFLAVPGEGAGGDDVPDAAGVIDPNPLGFVSGDGKLVKLVPKARGARNFPRLAHEDALLAIVLHDEVLEQIVAGVAHEDALAAIVRQVGIGDHVAIELPVERNGGAAVVVEFHVCEGALLGLVGCQAIELVVVGVELFDVHSAAMLFQNDAPGAAIMGGHILDLHIFGSADGDTIVPDEGEATCVTGTSAALELLCASIPVDGQVTQRYISNPVWDGSRRAANHHDRAVGSICEAEDGLGADTSKLDAVSINDDGLAHREEGGAKNDGAASRWQTPDGGIDGFTISCFHINRRSGDVRLTRVYPHSLLVKAALLHQGPAAVEHGHRQKQSTHHNLCSSPLSLHSLSLRKGLDADRVERFEWNESAGVMKGRSRLRVNLNRQ